MNLTLPRELQQFIEREIAVGNYQNEDEVIIAGLQSLQERQKKLEDLKRDIQSGRDQLDNGQYLEFDENTLRAYFDSIQERGYKRYLESKNEK